ncbi:MAG: HYR domain-containing protein [bacterium]
MKKYLSIFLVSVLVFLGLATKNANAATYTLRTTDSTYVTTQTSFAQGGTVYVTGTNFDHNHGSGTTKGKWYLKFYSGTGGTKVLKHTSPLISSDSSNVIKYGQALSSTDTLGTWTIEAYCATHNNLKITITFTVTLAPVIDTTPPVIDAHSDMTVEATGPSGAVVSYTVNSTDNVDGVLPAVCLPASGSTFALGTTTVNCNKTDSSGNPATSTSFLIIVVDTTPPEVGSASEIDIGTSSSSTVVTYTDPTANDDVDGPVSVTCVPPSGSEFPLGKTTVTCSATDSHGNTGSSSFDVTVSDTGAPSLVLPGNMVVEATGPSGAVVTFEATANDEVDGTRPVSCVPTSGSTFPLGTTTVNCSAEDLADPANEAEGSFTITVKDTTPPVITRLGSDPESVILGGVYTDAGATATDLVDGNLTPSIITVDPVNTSILGPYTVTYNVVDSAGNHATEVTRVVNVVPEIPTTGDIKIVKIVQDPNGGTTTDETFFVVNLNKGEVTSTSSLSESDDANFTGLSAGTYTISEELNPNYDLISITPDQDEELKGTQINLTLGTTTVVTVINRQHGTSTQPETFTLTYNSDTNGTISGSSTQVVAPNGTGTAVTANANNGYHFVNWSDTSTANPRIDSNVVGNITVTANFAANQTISSGGGGGSSGGHRRPVATTTTGQVLGASTELPSSCGLFISSYLKRGKANIKSDVVKLQQFLNEELGKNIPLTGFFGPITEAAVKEFQLKYADDVLEPWVEAGLHNSKNVATGYVYKTTQRKINLLKCLSLIIPMPELK